VAAPSNVRRTVLCFAFIAAFITYLDRVCISAAAPAMTAELGLTPTEMGYVFSVFAVAYGIFEIPMGWLGDRYGQRSLLTRIVACWSVFTMLTGAVRGLGALLAVRFVFGAAEAGAFPTMARALARWFPIAERGLTTGWMWAGARLGGSLAPPLAAWLVVAIGWRESFWAFGFLGLIWCLFFWRWYRDDPADHPAVNQAELEHIRSGRAPVSGHAERIPWGRLFSSRSLWGLFGMYFCSAFGFFFFVTWLPTYLINEYGLTLERSGWYSAMPLAAGAAACLLGGGFSDRLVRKTGSLRWGRRLVGVAGFLLAAAGFAGAAFAKAPLAAVLWLTFAQGAQDLTIPVAWAVCVDVGRRYGGTATGFMNTASSISAALSPIVAAWLQQRFGTFSALFAVAAGVYFIGALLWFVIDPEEVVED
jgi:sugar phosphate permease